MKTRTSARRALSRRHLWPLAVFASLVTLLTGGVTFAWWAHDAAVNGAVVTAGNFDISLGQLSWHSPTQGISGDGASSLAKLSLGDDDVLVVEQQITGDFSGTNLRVELGITWPGVLGDANCTWHVANRDGNQVAPGKGEASLGQKLTPSGMVAHDNWTVVISLTPASGTGSYADPFNAPKAGSVDLGSLTITANQVRG